jgi:hypothetical protein
MSTVAKILRQKIKAYLFTRSYNTSVRRACHAWASRSLNDIQSDTIFVHPLSIAPQKLSKRLEQSAIICDSTKPRVLIAVPKTAGTSISQSLFPRFKYRNHHPTASAYKMVLGDELFTRCFKMAFVREPYSRLQSAFHYLKSKQCNLHDMQFAQTALAPFKTFEQFVEHYLDERSIHSWMHFVPQYKYLCDQNGYLLVDFLGKYECLAIDYAKVCDILGTKANLQNHNRGAASSTIMAEANKDALKNKVYTLYRADYEMFGYNVSC